MKTYEIIAAETKQALTIDDVAGDIRQKRCRVVLVSGLDQFCPYCIVSLRSSTFPFMLEVIKKVDELVVQST